MIKLPLHKTKIICTIGPACSQSAMLEGMIKNGMSIARLNLSHGDFVQHAQNIARIRAVSSQCGRPVGIMIDLPGIKMRIGRLDHEPLWLKKNEEVVLTTTRQSPFRVPLVPVDYKKLTKVVSRRSIIFLNDGLIQLEVQRVRGQNVFCKVLTGGELLSHKGLNLPGAQLAEDPITRRDLQIVNFGLKHGVHIFGLSFIESAQDVEKVRQFAKKRGKKVFLIAKIERRAAIENFDAILQAADAVMIARGDMGVEIPLQELPAVQKKLIQKANLMGRPVITATQMLESMIHYIRPTRAEVNDVANAILDGTDAIMLSEETAIGDYPLESVKMMAQIAAATEVERERGDLPYDEASLIRSMVAPSRALTITDVTSLNAVGACEQVDARYIIVPTSSGKTARLISRFKAPCWILALSAKIAVCDFLSFSYGIYPFFLKKVIYRPQEVLKGIRKNGLIKKGERVIWTERRLSPQRGQTDSLSIITLR